MDTLRAVPAAGSSLDQMVTALVPSLSRSLAEQFNVFRVMHHGTHEKQLSNVFVWLLSVDSTHELGDAFQRLFIAQVNRCLPGGSELPTGGYRVMQEVGTSGHEDLGREIADIVLTSPGASVVVENYESSDGHGHDYEVAVVLAFDGDKAGEWRHGELGTSLQASAPPATTWRRFPMGSIRPISTTATSRPLLHRAGRAR